MKENKIPTAAFFYGQHFNEAPDRFPEICNLMIEFAKMHNEAQLEAIKNNDLDDIDNAYPLENIK